MQPPRERRNEAGLYLEIEIDPDRIRIVGAARIPRVARIKLHPPVMTPERIGEYRTWAAERVLAVLDPRGDLIDRFGWSAAGEAFFDRPGEEEDLRGSPGPSRQVREVLRVPTDERAAFLCFYGTQTGRRADGALIPELEYRLLGLYALGSGDLPVPPLPIPVPGPPGPIPLPIPWWRADRPLRPHIEPARWKTVRNGYIKDVRTIVSTGNPVDQFDIVIVGDGFQEAELGVFDTRVELIANGLLLTPPFDAIADRINVHSVRAVSTDSGITSCPAGGGKKNTFFNVEGNFNGQWPGFVGTHTPGLIYEAGEHIALREHLELFVMIANCTISGGSAFPDQDLACITMWADLTKFGNMAVHEAAHVIGKLSEEYIGCEPPDPCKTYPNRATEAERQADSIWWKNIANADELQSYAFRAIHVFGDPFDANEEPIVAPGLAGMLGLYWGCQDIDPAIPTQSSNCRPYQDPRGAPFYRAMARCKMRKSFFPFCRVCSLVIDEAIRAATP